MNCCTQCTETTRREYLLCGDGDGIEYLVEVAHLRSGGTAETTVVFSART